MHTLKPGDWVVVNNSIENIIKVEYEDYEEDGIETRIFIDHSEEYHGAEDVEMWNPKPNEWCWFWNDNNYVPTLRQFSSCLKTIDGTTIHLIKCGIEGYIYCEPFIGQLPSFINDNK